MRHVSNMPKEKNIAIKIELKHFENKKLHSLTNFLNFLHFKL